MIVAMNFREQSRFGLHVVIWKRLIVSKAWFAMRYSRFWIFGGVSSLRQKRWSTFSAFISLRSSLRLPLRAHLGLAPKELFLLSTPWTSVGDASLSLSLAKGQDIRDAPPDS